MSKLSLAAVLVVAMAGCAAHQGHPVLKDSNGWPYPTWAAMDGLVCYDAADHQYKSARMLNTDSKGYVCGYGPVNRGVQYDQTWVHEHSTAPAVTRAATAAYPDGAGPDVMR